MTIVGRALASLYVLLSWQVCAFCGTDSARAHHAAPDRKFNAECVQLHSDLRTRHITIIEPTGCDGRDGFALHSTGLRSAGKAQLCRTHTGFRMRLRGGDSSSCDDSLDMFSCETTRDNFRNPVEFWPASIPNNTDGISHSPEEDSIRCVPTRELCDDQY